MQNVGLVQLTALSRLCDDPEALGELELLQVVPFQTSVNVLVFAVVEPGKYVPTAMQNVDEVQLMPLSRECGCSGLPATDQVVPSQAKIRGVGSACPLVEFSMYPTATQKVALLQLTPVRWYPSGVGTTG